jgi:hypothetical protein
VDEDGLASDRVDVLVFHSTKMPRSESDAYHDGVGRGGGGGVVFTLGRLEERCYPVLCDLRKMLDGSTDELAALREELGEEVVEVVGDVDGDGLERLPCYSTVDKLFLGETAELAFTMVSNRKPGSLSKRTYLWHVLESARTGPFVFKELSLWYAEEQLLCFLLPR